MSLIYGALSSSIIRLILEDKKEEYFGTDFSPMQMKIATEVLSTIACLATVTILNLTNIC